MIYLIFAIFFIIECFYKMEIMNVSSGAVFVYHIEEAFNAFILDDHLVIQESEHKNILQIGILHRNDHSHSIQKAKNTPKCTCN